MRILLDNCVNHRLARVLSPHDVVHVRSLGWGELVNGKLLDAAESEGFDVLLTVDQNLKSQQDLSKRQISVLTLDTRSIIIESLLPFVANILVALDELELKRLIGQNIVVSLE